VAFGGTLWQDIETQKPDALSHVKKDLYESNVHAVEIMPETHLASLYPERMHGLINSIHHQAINKLAPGFVMEARSPADGIVEAIRSEGPNYIAAVQWHPEFRQKNSGVIFDDTPILQDFLNRARAIKRDPRLARSRQDNLP
jgi:putative glutamine amidotransferase